MILSLYAFFHFSFHSWSTELEVYCLLIPGGVAVHIFGIGEDSFEKENWIWILLVGIFSIMWARSNEKSRTHAVAQARLPQGTTSAWKLSRGKHVNLALTKQWLLLDFNFSTFNAVESRAHANVHFYNMPNMNNENKLYSFRFFVSTIQSSKHI